MSAAPPPLTLHRRLGPGPILRRGSEAAYRAVTIVDGEPHLQREDLLAGADPGITGRPLLCLAHVTDLQLADVQSPARFEFLNREFADPRFADLVPVQRPQEALTVHAVDATIRTLNALPGGPASGAPLELVVTTGDAIDNAQWNEVQAFLTLFEGGQVRPGSGGPGYEGVQALGWPDDIFWKPDGELPSGPDIFRLRFGFGHQPGLLEWALASFRAEGLRVPWLACFGNHEALIQGVGVVTPALGQALVGGKKPTRLQPGVDRDRALDLFIESADVYLDGDPLPITADPLRRPVSRQEFVRAHFRPAARPDGHGFTERNRLDGTAYYVHDTPVVRMIGLDTTCLAGAAAGSLDADQFRWLADRLAEVHSSYRAPNGTTVRTGHEDRLVILFSHHGLDTLTNPRPTGLPGLEAALASNREPIGADDLEALLHRFPNVVLWLNGHTHTNGVRARVNPAEPGRGFWEVTTCAVVDWPCQSRLVELLDTGDGLLSIVCTMVDHDSPVRPALPELGASGRRAEQAMDGRQLAGLHRELAGNVPWAGFDSPLAGTPADRNVRLRIRAPFPLERLPGR